MARQSQTEIAVLGGLSVEPMTGYGLRTAISEVLGHFWNESFGQIYPTLARLEEQGLVRRESPGKTSGSVFEITDAGLSRLRSLLADPVPSAPPRNGLLLRLFFGQLLDRGKCDELLNDALEAGENQVQSFIELRREIEREPPNPNTPFWIITIAAGYQHALAQVDWAREALAILREIPVHQK